MNYLQQYPAMPGALIAPRRNNYYFSKLMDVLHFQLERTYDNDMRRLLNRLSLGDGVLCGLSVEKGDNGKICVLPGLAVDTLGREIIVSEKACIDPWTLTDDCCGQPIGNLSKEERHLVHLCLAYRECFTDFAPLLVTDCNLKDECAPGTVVESFRLIIQDKPPPSIESGVCQALLSAGFAYEIVATIETGGKPVAIAISHDGQRALVANEEGPALHVIDLDTNAVTPLSGATLNPPIGGLSVAPEGGLAFVTHAEGIVMVDLESDPPKIAGSIAFQKLYGACAAATGGKVLYAIDSNAKKVDCIDIPTSSITTTIDTGDGPADLAVSSTSKWLYVMDLQKKELVRVDCSSNEIVAGASKPINDNSKTLAVRNGAAGSEAFVAWDGNVTQIAEDGTQADFSITADAQDSAFTTSGGRYYLLNRTGNEFVAFRADGMTEIARLPVDAEPVSIAVVPDSRRALVAYAGAISIIDIVARKQLCEALSGPCPEAMACPCVSLATIELLEDGTIGVIDSCSNRRMLYSNAMLFEFILCLAARLDECCAESAGPQPPAPTTFRIEAVEFRGAEDPDNVLATLQDPNTVLEIKEMVGSIRVVFNKEVKADTVTAATNLGELDKASFRVEYEVPIDDPFYPLGEITPDPDPKAIRWVMPDDGSLNVFGIYTVTFFGDANDRPAITDASEPSQRLDGDRDGKEGGNFQFTFIAGAG